jgi:hypothetical protein
MNQLPIPRTTLTQMVLVYQQCEADIRQAYGLLVSAQKQLKETFKPDSYLFNLDRRECRHYDRPDETIGEIKKDAWRALIDRLELRRVLSVKRAAELDEQLKTGEGLPEITEPTIIAMLEGTLSNVHQFMEESVKEVFEFLRPHCSQYKTNTEFEIGKRVILGWIVEPGYNKNFHVSYQRQQNLTALDNVFHRLDGQGTIKTSRGSLVDAIEAPNSRGKGETAYFKFKCFRNRNLHLEFKRMDLVAKLNAVAGGNRLKDK